MKLKKYRPSDRQIAKYMTVLKYYRAKEAEKNYTDELAESRKKRDKFFIQIQEIKKKFINKQLERKKAVKMIDIIGKAAESLNKLPSFIQARDILTYKYADLIEYLLTRQMKIITQHPEDRVFFSITWPDEENTGCKDAALMLYVFHSDKTITFYETFKFGLFLKQAYNLSQVPLKPYCQYAADDLFVQLGQDHKDIIEGTMDNLYNKLGYKNNM